jgi:hypothetical protein
MNITEYVKEQGIEVKVVEEGGYDRDENGWEHNAWTLQLVRGDRVSEEFAWKQGLGITDSPVDTPDQVFDSLVSDATGYLEAQSFEDFAENFGYDTDSRKAEAIYDACGETANWLDDFLDGELRSVAYEVDRI